MRLRLTLLTALLASGAITTGCGGDDDDEKASTTKDDKLVEKVEKDAEEKDVSPDAARREVIMIADAQGQLILIPNFFETPAGEVHIELSNPTISGKAHAIAIEGGGVDEKGDEAKPGQTSKIDLELKSGTYELYCPVAGHRKGGMRGRLIVRS